MLSYYRNCDAAFLVYDITNKETFKHIPDWINEVRTFSNLPQNRQPKILIIGNKADMEYQREVSRKELHNLASKLQKNTKLKKIFLYKMF